MTKQELEALLNDISLNGKNAIENLKQLSNESEIDKVWAEFWLMKTERLLVNTNDRLLALTQNKMLIYDDTAEVKPFWESIMKTVQTSIQTTNIVKNSTFGNALNDELLLMQKKAIERDVTIERIFIYPTDEQGKEDPEQVTALKSFMATQLAYEITVYAIKMNVFKSASKSDGLETGSDDFMIIDDKFVYETHYEESEGLYRNFMRNDIEDLKKKKQIWETVKSRSKEITFQNVNNFNEMHF